VRALPAFAIASLGLLCASAHAQTASVIELELPDCLGPAWRDQLISSASIELREDGASLITHESEREGSVHIAVAVPCNSDPNEAEIAIHQPSKTEPLSRTVQLADVPHHLRPRTLAIALAELWRTSHTRAPRAQDLASNRAHPQPTAANLEAPVQPNAAATAIDTSRRDATNNADAQSGAPTLSLAPALRVYFAARNALPGAQLAFGWRSWRIGAEGYYGEHVDQLGSARFGVIQGFLSWELARIHFGAYGLALAPRAAIGGILATASAQAPAFASSATITSWDASAEAAFWRMLTTHWRFALRVQLGYAHGPVLASDAGELARLHGLFATAGLSLELHLSDS
jgi:hypothetical protein